MADVMMHCGQLTEATFLSSLLEANGIGARLASEAPSSHDEVGVYVASSDVARARPFIEDFEARGKKSAAFWHAIDNTRMKPLALNKCMRVAAGSRCGLRPDR